MEKIDKIFISIVIIMAIISMVVYDIGYILNNQLLYNLGSGVGTILAIILGCYVLMRIWTLKT